MNKNENHRPFDVISHEEVFVGRFKIIKDTIRIAGEDYPYSYDASDDCVVILPFIGEKVVLIKEYRHCLNDWFWEVPAGGVGKRNPLEAAKAELLEETGCKANELIFIGKYPVSLGTSSSYSYIYAAECKFRGTQNLEKTEFIKVQEVSITKFEEMIGNKEFLHMAGIIAWTLYKEKRQQKGA